MDHRARCASLASGSAARGLRAASIAILALAAPLVTACGGDDAAETTTGTTTGGSAECSAATAEDGTASMTALIEFGGPLGSTYSPDCLKVAAGTTVEFRGTFASHPLRSKTTGSPIQDTAMGTTASFTFPAAGEFAYDCQFHAASGMDGKIFVE